MARRVAQSRFRDFAESRFSSKSLDTVPFKDDTVDVESRRLLTLAFVTERTLKPNFLQLNLEFLRLREEEILTVDHVTINTTPEPSSPEELDAYPAWVTFNDAILETEFLIEGAHYDDSSRGWRKVVTRAIADYTLERHKWALRTGNYDGLGSESPWVDHIVYVDSNLLRKLGMTVQQFRYALRPQITDAYLVLAWDGNVDDAITMLQNRRSPKTFVQTDGTRFAGWAYAMTQLAHNTNERKVYFEDLVAISRIFDPFTSSLDLMEEIDNVDGREDAFEVAQLVISETIMTQLRELVSDERLEDLSKAQAILLRLTDGDDPGQALVDFEKFVSDAFDFSTTTDDENLAAENHNMTEIDKQLAKINAEIDTLTNNIENFEGLVARHTRLGEDGEYLSKQLNALKAERDTLQTTYNEIAEQIVAGDDKVKTRVRALNDEKNNQIDKDRRLAELLEKYDCSNVNDPLANRLKNQFRGDEIAVWEQELKNPGLREDDRAELQATIERVKEERYWKILDAERANLERLENSVRFEEQRLAEAQEAGQDTTEIQAELEKAERLWACTYQIVDPEKRSITREIARLDAEIAKLEQGDPSHKEELTEELTKIQEAINEVERQRIATQELYDNAEREFHQVDTTLVGFGDFDMPVKRSELANLERERKRLSMKRIDVDVNIRIVRGRIADLEARTELLNQIGKNAKILIRITRQEVTAEELGDIMYANQKQGSPGHAAPVFGLTVKWLMSLFDGLVSDTPFAQRFNPTDTEKTHLLVSRFPQLSDHPSFVQWRQNRLGLVFVDAE